jgi:acyl-CoA dehydrogenase
MDFTVPSDVEDLVARTRRFREEELLPLEPEFLAEGSFDNDVRLQLQQRGKEQGLWGIDSPVEHGGLAMNHLGYCKVIEELFHSPLMFEFGGSAEPVLYACEGDQREQYLYPCFRGEKRSAYGFSEPAAGSDFGGIQTTAVRDGDHFVLNGQKKFIGMIDRAEFVILFASTNPSRGARGITCFLVDIDSPGFKVVRSLPTMGDQWLPFELAFEDMVVPEANVLGEVDHGFGVAAQQLTHGRLKIAAMCLGVAQRALDIAVEWAIQRTTWGKPIASRQAIQFMLADSQVELDAARLLTYRAAWTADQELPIQNEAFMAKLYAAEMAQRVTDRCLQVQGGLGYLRESPLQSLFRQARVWRIGHGTSEIHRWMIARNMLGKAADDA